MSDLKHRTPDELREIIRKGEEYADRLDQMAGFMRQTAAATAKKAHNSRQRTTWAKIYLAQKELDKPDVHR